MRLSARASAIAVSSVHSPGARSKGPPPTLGMKGLAVPGVNSSGGTEGVADSEGRERRRERGRGWPDPGQV